MLAAAQAALPADIAIFAAAVADWRVASQASEKIKKGGKALPRLELVENPDILKTIAAERPGRRPPLVIGFAAETENVLEYAAKKRKAKGRDWIVANDVSPADRHHGRRPQHRASRDRGRSGELARAGQGRGGAPADAARRRAAGRDHRRDVKREAAVSSAAVVTIAVVRLPHGRGLDLPAYQSAGAAGMDLLAAVPKRTPLRLAPGARALVPTGLVLQLPPGFEAQVRPRSGLALRHGITVLNSPGTIDSDYRGEVQVLLANLGSEPFAIARGERIAQLVVQRVEQARLVEVAEIAPTPRGAGGFGSTGVKAKAKRES